MGATAKPMSATAAAKQWLQADVEYRDAKRRREAAEKVLKPYMRGKKLQTFRGVAISVVHGKRLIADKARELLGDRAHLAEAPTETVTLSAVPK